MQFFIDMLAGAATGVVTGFGIGGGTLLILYLTLFRGEAQLTAQGVNLLYFLPSAASALVSHIKNRRIIWRAVIFGAGAGLITTIAAALIAARLDIGILRKIFGGFLLIVGITELLKKDKKN